jgi:hypothetical protein
MFSNNDLRTKPRKSAPIFGRFSAAEFVVVPRVRISFAPPHSLHLQRFSAGCARNPRISSPIAQGEMREVRSDNFASPFESVAATGVPAENSNSNVVMMQPAENWNRGDVTNW